MSRLIIMCGPPGSGKSTYAKERFPDFVYVNQDSQGRDGHKEIFNQALIDRKHIIVDRMNFNKEQRDRYLVPAKALGYKTEIIVLHENRETCLKRCLEREGHETIHDEKGAQSALNMFFTKYEKPLLKEEADVVIYQRSTKDKTLALIIDLDGSLCDIEHRQHHVLGEKKNWKAFFEGIPNDKLNSQVYHTLMLYYNAGYKIILCSGRDDNQRKNTVEWLEKFSIPYDKLFMRNRNDYRKDTVIKENILDFEILTEYEPFLALDDRDSVVEMWRSRGVKCFQVQKGDF